MSDGTENLIQHSSSELHISTIQIPIDKSSSAEPCDPALELLQKGVSAVLAACPAKPVHKPPLTSTRKASEKIPRAILRHSIILQRKQIEKYIKYINTTYTNPTAATLTQFFAYFIEQINIAGTLFSQYFDFNKNTSFKNRFPEFVEYLLNAFTYLDENKNRFTLDERMHMLASCNQDFSSTKMENFYKIKDYLTQYDAKAKDLYAQSDYEFYLSFHNYCKSVFTLVTTFETALWIRDANLTSENHKQSTIENDKYVLEGIRI